MIRLLTDLAEHPRANAGTGTMSAALDRKLNRKRSELFNAAWTRCEAFLRIAQSAYQSRTGAEKEMTMPGLLGPAFRERLSAAMRIPVVETLFKEPWTAAARRVLPSPSPQMTATAMWGPIIAWCALETLAESINAAKPEQVALDAFDRLRLRQPLAESFNALGFEGETGWRAAARIKVVLMAEAEAVREAPAPQVSSTPASQSTEAKLADAVKPTQARASTVEQNIQPAPAEKAKAAAVPKPIIAGLPRALWTDPDVRWLTGVHDAGEHTWFVCEPFEELLWWLQMPALLSIASESAPSKAKVLALSEMVHTASAEADKAEYRLDVLLAPETPATTESGAGESRIAPPENKPPRGSKNLQQLINVSDKSIAKEDLPVSPKK